MQSFLQRHRVILLHLSFWCVYLSFFIYQITSFRRREIELAEAVYHGSLHTLFNMAVAYLNYFVFLPRFLERKRVGRYLLEFSIPFAAFMIARIHLQRYIIDGYTRQAEYFYSTTFAIQATATTLFIVIFVGMLRFVKDWFELESRKKEVEHEKVLSELNFLKAQINPHFLFNTLNNLYYLAYSQSPNTTEVIAKLSQMMRYMIYDTNHAKVPLRREIEYMQNYISLERLRLNNQIPIEFSVEGEPGEIHITPLIFITFLENAFKHGVSNTSQQAWVRVSIRIDATTCIYIVENSKLPGSNLSSDEKSGIGLQNVQRRLALSYPGRHTLTFDDSADRYRVALTLQL